MGGGGGGGGVWGGGGELLYCTKKDLNNAKLKWLSSKTLHKVGNYANIH